jgi:hypothetical protein
MRTARTQTKLYHKACHPKSLRRLTFFWKKESKIKKTIYSLALANNVNLSSRSRWSLAHGQTTRNVVWVRIPSPLTGEG